MSVTIDGVPETVSRDDYVSLIRHYGFNPDRLKSLTFGARSIVAEVFPDDEALGQGYHTVVIKVED